MGCGASDMETDAPRDRNNPLVANLKETQKEIIVDHIDSDDLVSLATYMEKVGNILCDVGAKPNSEISDEGMRWMLIHLCCRWDSDDCLEFLLKEYFADHPGAYVDLVNSQTIEGYTCLHLCAIWMS